MKGIFLRFGSILLLYLMVVTTCWAQPQKVGISLSAGLSSNSYFGDLSDKDYPTLRANPGYLLQLSTGLQKKNQNQITIGYTTLTDQKNFNLLPAVGSVRPNNFFHTHIYHLDFRKKYFLGKGKILRPYASIGVGLLFFTPKDAEGNFLIENLDSRPFDESYGAISAHFPLTIGANVKISKKINLYTEANWRFLTSDYLDNVGQMGTRKGNDKMLTFACGMSYDLYFKDNKKYLPPIKPIYKDSLKVPPVLLVRVPKPQLPEAELLPSTDSLYAQFLALNNPVKPKQDSNLVAVANAKPRETEYEKEVKQFKEELANLQKDIKSFADERNGITKPKEEVETVRASIYRSNEGSPYTEAVTDTAGLFNCLAAKSYENLAALSEIAIAQRQYLYYRVTQPTKLTNLAEKFRVNPIQLKQMNSLSSFDLKPGTFLMIPDVCMAILPEQPKVQVYDENYWKTKTEEALKTEQYQELLILEGESIAELSKRTHISEDLIRKLNNFPKSQMRVKAGDKLKLPDIK